LICTFADDVCFIFTIDDRGFIKENGKFKADFKIGTEREPACLTVCKFNPSGTIIGTAGEDTNLR
jgi:hypothetical protein